MTSFSNPNEFDKERMICNIMDNYQKHCEVLRSVSPELLRLYWIKSNSLVQDTMEYLESEKLRLRPTTIVHQYENHGTWKKKSTCFPCYTERIKISLLYMYQLHFATIFWIDLNFCSQVRCWVRSGWDLSVEKWVKSGRVDLKKDSNWDSTL